MKKFLLIAGDNYYPEAGTEDWIATLKTEEEAASEVTPKTSLDHWLGAWEIRGCHYDWYDIIDLREWVN
jgi:hypothetical protein